MKKLKQIWGILRGEEYMTLPEAYDYLIWNQITEAQYINKEPKVFAVRSQFERFTLKGKKTEDGMVYFYGYPINFIDPY